MRIRQVVQLFTVPLFIVALVALAMPAALGDPWPSVPLQGVEANRLTLDTPEGFGDGPTPFPGPRPPRPGPVPDGMTVEQAMSWVAQGRTWFTRLPDGGLRFHSCLDAIPYRLAGETEQVRDFVVGLAQTSATQIDLALMPWEQDVRSAVHEIERLTHARMATEEINRLWLTVVSAHADEIALAIPETASLVEDGECTTGPCNCTTCPKGTICDCQWYVPGDEDCRVMVRVNCDVRDDPPVPAPESRSVDIRWGN